MLLFVTLRMPLKGSFFSRTFTFRFEARTSRGRMKDRRSWFVKLSDTAVREVAGWGECAPLPGLSIDDVPEFEHILSVSLNKLSGLRAPFPDAVTDLVRSIVPVGFPSVAFGLETALLDLAHGGRRIVFENSFVDGKPIPINGLIWMGDENNMMEQIEARIEKGFTCIKLKVGGLDFEAECDILRSVRDKFDNKKITLRLDANGAFEPGEALRKLERLSEFSIHSIEQPLKAGASELNEICRLSPIPVALDEELIGHEHTKAALLEKIRPSFIVLKPTLHGGLAHCSEWIAEAERIKTGWWITSALESNIGLNAISQFTAEYDPLIPQGLGTGSIYQDNIASPLKVAQGQLFSDPNGCWQTPEL
jgi:o-succinylbenzoate synthase